MEQGKGEKYEAKQGYDCSAEKRKRENHAYLRSFADLKGRGKESGFL